MNATTDVLAQWQHVGRVDPTLLADARLQLHHALQIIVSAPISFLPSRSDDSHTNLEWVPELAALGTNWLPAKVPRRFALQPAALSLLSISGDGVTSDYALGGRTVDGAVDWVRREITAAGCDGARLTTTKHYDIPSHPVASGAAFSLEPSAAFEELGRYYANAHGLTTLVAAQRVGASPPRCWPHHFDLATLITLPESPGRETRTVSLGMSPGDDSYAEPYFYVGPYPHPPVERLRPLGSLGTWHTSGWLAAVLLATEIVGLAADRQAQAALAFANAAIDASIEALDAGP